MSPAAAISRRGTFSIVAYDRAREQWGIAVQSKFISVGSVVPWARAKVGAVATQALANVSYGPDGLDLMEKGLAAPDVVRKLTSSDPKREHRQVGAVDRRGEAAAFTGKECMHWAGHEVGDGFSCQGNILFSEAVVRAMARSFESTPGDLPERLLAALAAGQREGGDRRGMQSAALLVVRSKGGYEEGNDRWIDVRVDDHVSPIEELRRVFRIYDLTLLSREDPATLVTWTPELVRTVQTQLQVLGFLPGVASGTWDARTKTAFEKFLSEQNFENKRREDDKVWPSILEHLAQRARDELERRASVAPIVPGALDRGPGATAGGVPSAPRSAKAKGKASH